MRVGRHRLLGLVVLCAALHAAAQPLVLAPLPLPGRFTDLEQSSSGALLVHYGHWSEYGGARLSMLQRNGRWMQVPAGAAFEWKDWLVFEGLFPVPRNDDESAPARSPWGGGTRIVTMGTDDAFVRRVVLVHGKSGQRFEAPWDSLAPLPLGDGETWLVWRCPLRPSLDGGVDEPLELIVWAPRSGRTRVVGALPGEARASCAAASAAHSLSVITFPEGGLRTTYGETSVAYVPAVVPTRDGALAQLTVDGGASRWVQLDGRGRVVRGDVDAGVALSSTPPDAGSPLAPLRRVNEAFVDAAELRTADGGTVAGWLADGGSFPLTPSMGGGFAVHAGLVFTDEGVFQLPAKAPALARP